MVLIVELLIFIFLKVQANDLVHIHSCLPSPSIIHLHLSELDKVQNNDFPPTSSSLSLHFLSRILNRMNLMKLKDQKRGVEFPRGVRVNINQYINVSEKNIKIVKKNINMMRLSN